MITSAVLSARRDERGASMIFTLLSLTMVTVLGLNLLGDGIRDLLDPRLRRLG